MTSFLITGEGYPFFKILKAVREMLGASIAGAVIGATTSTMAESFAVKAGSRIFSLAILTGKEPFPKEAQADWLVNINGATIITAEVVNRFPKRAINMHPGLLPQYAGLHCTQWAIRNGEAFQGITIHLMDEGVDTGDILAQKTIPILKTDTGLSLFMRTIETGSSFLINILKRIVEDDVPSAMKQDFSLRRLYRHKDALGDRVDWKWDSLQICNFVRAANYEPLVCPTYTPVAEIVGKRFVLRTCVRMPNHLAAAAGTLLQLTEQGPVVACGNQEAVLITRAFYKGEFVIPSKWRELAALT